MTRVEEIVAPRRRRTPVDEHRCQLVRRRLVVLPHRLQFFFQFDRVRTLFLQLRCNAVLFCSDDSDEIVVDFFEVQGVLFL